jgi:hypothetical protein
LFSLKFRDFIFWIVAVKLIAIHLFYKRYDYYWAGREPPPIEDFCLTKRNDLATTEFLTVRKLEILVLTFTLKILYIPHTKLL